MVSFRASGLRLRSLLVDVNETSSWGEQISVQHSSDEHHQHPVTSPVGIVIALGFTIGVVICVYVLIRRKKGKRATELPLKDFSVHQGLLGPLIHEQATPLDGKQLLSDITFNFESLRWVPKHIEFTLPQLSIATNNFDEANVLGEGGFGKVYMGILPIPPYTRIAIKVLRSGSTQGLKEFITEVEVLSRLDHENLVRLLGHCVTEEERILVYRHVANGSLANHLHKGPSEGSPLSWGMRVKIALGAGLGVYHLHQQHPRILHRDIKAANILLTRSFNAKVCDFGFAKQVCATPLHPSSLSQTLKAHCCTPSRSCAMGTLGYVAPETFATGEFSAASDVYSFGVVLLELLSGRKPVDITRPEKEKSVVGWARNAAKDGKLDMLLDPSMPNSSAITQESLTEFARIAVACVSMEPSARPSMGDVVERLQNLQAEHRGRQLQQEDAWGPEQGSSECHPSSSSSSGDSSKVFYDLTSSNFASPAPDFSVDEPTTDEEVQSGLSVAEDGRASNVKAFSWLNDTLSSVALSTIGLRMRG